MPDPRTASERNAVAIVGMAGRFPGAADVDELWRNLRGGVESIVFFTDEELAAAGVDRATYSAPDYVRARAPLDGAELFDAALFGISPREAEMMDPQQRLFLECAFAALEDAGYDAQSYPGAIGIFGGANASTYLGLLYSQPERVRAFGSYNTLLANDKDYLATRAAYKLNLQGPAITVQTACSTALVAVHLACQSLLRGECDLALAGGVALSVPERAGYTYEPHGISSPDGHCRAFDAAARGTVGGSGVGIVVLRRLAPAQADGDSIRAVIRGTAVNNDGSLKLSYTAPSLKAQAQVVAEALAVAGVEPDTVGFVEAHGTGTTLGDPVEAAALIRAFASRTARRGFCALGSIKTNIGHLDAAAGIAGLIKAVQALRHGEIPPTLHFQTPNPQIDFAHSPFFVNNTRIDWPLAGHPRRAGVTSLGIGGTNAHVVLEEAPAPAPAAPGRPAQVLVFSAATASALEAVVERAARHLGEHPEADLADVAYTYQVGRRLWPHRRAVVVHGAAEAAATLAGRSPRVAGLICEARERPVCFLLSGQGSQHVGMGSDLYRCEPGFREQVDRCAEILLEPLGLDLRRVLFPTAADAGADAFDLEATALAQPALFTLEYALARLFMEWGVTPRALLGHSVGEYVAACLAGVFSLEAALRLVAARGRLMQGLPGGAMLAVPLPAAELEGLLGDGLSLAAINGPSLAVVAGSPEAVAALAAELAARGTECRRLRVSHAFHSAAVEPILAAFEEEVRRAGPRPGKIPYLANLTGTWQTAEGAADPAYWVRHMRQTVLFGPALEQLFAEPEAVLLEIGPGKALAALARRHPARQPEQLVLAAMRPPRSRETDLDAALGALSHLWLAGVAIDWPAFHRHARRRRLALPTYPFERRRYWAESAAARPEAGVTMEGRPARGAAVDDWLYSPEWRRSSVAKRRPDAELERAPRRWLLLLDGLGCGEELARSLAAAGQEVKLVRTGGDWARQGEASFTLNPGERGHYGRLASELAAAGWSPDHLVHLWSLTEPDPAAAGSPAGESPWLYSLLFLADAFGRQSASHPVDWTVITQRTQRVAGDEPLEPGKAALLGPCRVIPQEYPDISCRLLDVALPPPSTPAWSRLAERLVGELFTADAAAVVAHRGALRWEQTFRLLPASAPAEAGAAGAAGAGLRPGGVYAITGGMGRIGMELAAYLARQLRAKLVLLGRSPLPAREDWAAVIAGRTAGDPLRGKLAELAALTEEGAEILTLAVDVGDREGLRAAVAVARARFGAIDGVFHAAGSLDEGAHRPIAELEPAGCAALFRAKVDGLAALAEIFAAEGLDFLVAFSSLSTVLGGLGYAAYAAANAAMTALAHELARTSGIRCLSLDWDAWRLGGEAAATGLGSRLSDLALSPAEGIATLERALALDAGAELVVSASDLAARIEQWVGLSRLRGRGAGDAGGGHGGAGLRHVRPGLLTPYAAPRNEIEEALVSIWQELLGIEPVGIDDNFFDLGGHSLLGIQVNARLRRMFKVDIALRALFDSPTVAELAEVVEIALIGEIAELSDEEAAGLLLPGSLLEGDALA